MQSTSEYSKEIATTIYQQLGGNQFAANLAPFFEDETGLYTKL